MSAHLDTDASPRRPQHGAAVWRTSDVTTDTSWRIDLDDLQRAAIATASRDAAARGVTIDTMTAEQFPLDTLADAVGSWSRTLENGRGFLLLRGFPIDLLDEHETELAYVGLGCHLGTPVGQNAQSELLTHVRDERLPSTAGKVRLYRTRERQDFHTDGADIIGLLCLRRALRGGESKLVSSWALYNEILDHRPDLLEAMEFLEQLANDPTFHVEMDFQPGDVQFLNNGRILHAREAYDDHPDPDQRRHLLRLWLAAHRFASLEDGLRGGITSDSTLP